MRNTKRNFKSLQKQIRYWKYLNQEACNKIASLEKTIQAQKALIEKQEECSRLTARIIAYKDDLIMEIHDDHEYTDFMFSPRNLLYHILSNHRAN